MFKIPNPLIFINFCVLESCQVWAISYSEIECYVRNYFKMSKITLTLWYSFVHGIKANAIFRLGSRPQHTSLHIDKYSKPGKIIRNTINVWFPNVLSMRPVLLRLFCECKNFPDQRVARVPSEVLKKTAESLPPRKRSNLAVCMSHLGSVRATDAWSPCPRFLMEPLWKQLGHQKF